MTCEQRETLKERYWGMFDETSAELVKAKRRLREGIGTNRQVAQHRIMLSTIRVHLAALGEFAETVEPGD